MAIEIVDFTIKNGGSFQFVMWQFTMSGNQDATWCNYPIPPKIKRLQWMNQASQLGRFLP